jgi:hypothetical protein
LHPSHTGEGWAYNETALRLFKDNDYPLHCHKITYKDHKTSKSTHTEEMENEKQKSAVSTYTGFQTAVLQNFLIKVKIKLSL